MAACEADDLGVSLSWLEGVACVWWEAERGEREQGFLPAEWPPFANCNSWPSDSFDQRMSDANARTSAGQQQSRGDSSVTCSCQQEAESGLLGHRAGASTSSG